MMPMAPMGAPPPAARMMSSAALDAAGPPSKVIALMNMFTPDDLADDEAYAEINDDTKSECERFGGGRGSVCSGCFACLHSLC